MKEALTETLFLSPLTETEINKIIRALKDSATGHDDISWQFPKLVLDSIVDPLTHICNMPLTEGVFPDTQKVANAIPLYKDEDTMCFNHYRSVSLLCILSKVFEKILYDRLLNYVNKFDLLYAHQYGFRKNRSTYMALLSLVDNLTQALENGEHVIGVHLNFSKAFDTVDHMILLEKLYHYGVHGCAHGSQATCLADHSSLHIMVSNLIIIMSNVVYHKAPYWVHFYFFYNVVITSKRRHFDVIMSKWRRFDVITTLYRRNRSGPSIEPNGAPHLTLLWLDLTPLAFECKRTSLVLFADDSNLFQSGKNADYVQELINDELKYIVIWLIVNKLSLNISKTHYMLFSNKKLYNQISQLKSVVNL